MTLKKWLYKLCDEETPDDSIAAFNFGLFETENGYSIYLTGSKTYDESDSDWVCNEDFVPINKYLHLQTADFKWEMVLERIKTDLEEFVKTDKFQYSFFADAEAITIGFDDGDLIRIK